MRKLAEIIGWLTITLCLLGIFGLIDFRYCFAPVGSCFK